ncbi:MAG: hypothetical protein LC689_00330 [Myxococcales bacterium]|nr:hypothetical protein [Myxococcales bacterium]
MSDLQVDGARIPYQDAGGPGPAIVFSHGLLWRTAMYRFQIEAFRKDFRPHRVRGVRRRTTHCPTIVTSGAEDGVVPARSERTAPKIPGAKFMSIPRPGHTSSIEEPEAVNAALREFWSHIG